MREIVSCAEYKEQLPDELSLYTYGCRHSYSPPYMLNSVQSFDADETAVVFIHGLFSSSAFWFDTKIVPCLSDDIKAQHRLLVPDILGCGRSPRPIDSVYTLSDHIDALEKSVIQRHGLKSFHLVAHSMGCIMALVLAARCPERVRSITLIAPVYPPGDFDENGKTAQLPCDAIFSLIDPFTVSILPQLFVRHTLSPNCTLYTF